MTESNNNNNYKLTVSFSYSEEDKTMNMSEWKIKSILKSLDVDFLNTIVLEDYLIKDMDFKFSSNFENIKPVLKSLLKEAEIHTVSMSYSIHKIKNSISFEFNKEELENISNILNSNKDLIQYKSLNVQKNSLSLELNNSAITDTSFDIVKNILKDFKIDKLNLNYDSIPVFEDKNYKSENQSLKY